ncbi:tail fiber domain-containing protein [Pantoea brenneri]|uniref:tail fiber domain-containing protein n=1 Tax=Pantoea brenneri TaxID=472694 RepID=UPI00289E80DB|nr:tail fiber domain-containing protein [Pantoea brenneri]
MPAGTIRLTNNSASVTGTGTAFTTELKANDFLVAVVGGVTYTLGVKSVESATALTLVTAYNGPTTSGLAWTPVPNAALVGITAQVAADVAKAIRGLNLDKANWQQFYSGTGTITVTLPDGTTYTGPAWNSLGNSATRNVGTTLGTVAAGDDGRFSTVNGMSGGTLSSGLSVSSSGNYAYTSNYANVIAEGTTGNYLNRYLYINARDASYDIQFQYRLVAGQYHCYRSVQNGAETFRANSNGANYALSFNPTSDSNLKFNKNFIDSALSKALSLRGMTYNIQGDRKAGVIAQDAQKQLPESVTVNNDPVVLEDGTILEETLSLDYSAIAGLHTEALKDIVKLMLLCLENPGEAKSQLQTLVSSINNSLADENKTDMKMEWALLNPPLSPKEKAEDQSSDTERAD